MHTRSLLHALTERGISYCMMLETVPTIWSWLVRMMPSSHTWRYESIDKLAKMYNSQNEAQVEMLQSLFWVNFPNFTHIVSQCISTVKPRTLHYPFVLQEIRLWYHWHWLRLPASFAFMVLVSSGIVIGFNAYLPAHLKIAITDMTESITVEISKYGQVHRIFNSNIEISAVFRL